MTEVYYYLVLVNAAVSLAAAIVVFWKNRFQPVGPLLGATMLTLSVWAVAFSFYFKELPDDQALVWGKITIAASIMNLPFYFHGMCAVVEQMRRFRIWIVLSYIVAAFFLGLLIFDQLIVGLKETPVPFMAHYLRYNRDWYPLLGLHEMGWPTFAICVMIYYARKEIGYRRTQLVYLITAASIVFLTTTSIILPLEYDLYVQPFGLFLLPINLIMVAYALAKARLADFNVVFARAMLYTVMLLVVVGMTFLLIFGVTVIQPGFLNAQQILFTVFVATVIGTSLALSLPRLLPRAERLMEERLFGQRYAYQDALTGLIKELDRLPSIDHLLTLVATTVHTQMRLSKTLIYLRDPLSGRFRLQAQSGLTVLRANEITDLPEDNAVTDWLRKTRDALVLDELERQISPLSFQFIKEELDRLGVVVAIPMILEDKIEGILCLGEKDSQDMFFISDLKAMQNLATEVSLAVKYRRMEDEILRKNKLIELGTIAAGVAHEIRNPLASIRTFAQLIPERMDDKAFLTSFSELVLGDVERISKVVESMLSFARPSKVDIADHTATEMLEEAVLLLQPRLKSKRVNLSKSFHDNPVIKVDKQKILQILINLLSNATDAVADEGNIRLAAGVRRSDESNYDRDGKNYVVIEVADDGPGIPIGVRNQVFDPFFTTKKEGMGLGLSISQKIARDHGGFIAVESQLGHGATFRLHLPIAESSQTL